MGLWFWASLFLSGFVCGALVVLALQGLALLYFIFRLEKKATDLDASTLQPSPHELHLSQSVQFLASHKQGVVWVLDPEKLPKDTKKRKDVFEVSPVQKHAKIKDHTLLLTEPDGLHTSIQLKSCVIEAVSATTLPSKKWAKKFPLKVESKNTVIYNGSKVFYIYLETSWEKESWCKALRLASCNDRIRLDWFGKLNEEFHNYLTSLNLEYPLFAKPLVGIHAEPADRTTKSDGSYTKVRQLLKKFSKKATKSNAENKAGWASYSGREERKIIEKFRPSRDSGSVKTAEVKTLNSSFEENVVLPPPPSLPHSGSQSNVSVNSDADLEDKLNIDEGTLCWNLLISRFFFDAKSSIETKKVVQTQIQRALSSMRTPTYIGDIICTDIDFGSVPPYIHCMRILPMDMKEVWAFEVDFEYSGGIVLGIKTRLETRELDMIQENFENANSESRAAGDFTPDLLEEIEYYGKKLNLSDETKGDLDPKDERYLKDDASNGSKFSTLSSTSKWKSMLQSIAKQVSQVPISLAVRVSSLRGTLRIHIKPPPSDQLWFSFTSMPDINFNLESSVGDHKISNEHIALFLINKFKAAIKDTMVLPNCVSGCVPFMQAEKDDWIPRKAAPFIWHNGEAFSDPTVPMSEPLSSHSGLPKGKTDATIGVTKHQALEKETLNRPSAVNPPLSSSTKPLPQNKSFQELKAPLLVKESCRQNGEEIPESEYESSSSSGHVGLTDRSISFGEDDSKPERWGRKARMLDIGKKMGEKIEEKRRHIEERSRNIVEKMRGP